MRRWLVSWLALALGACSFSPPVNATHGGAPGRLRSDQGDIRTAGGWAGLDEGHVTLAGAVPLGDELKLELAPEVGLSGAGPLWSLGRAGLRWTPAPAGEVVGDLELGIGLGVGGSDDDDRAWFERATGGAYLGTGFGVWIEPEHAFFVRIRVQVSATDPAPVFGYASSVLGFDIGLGPVRLDIAAGGWLMFNGNGAGGSGLVEIGVSVPLGPGPSGRRPTPVAEEEVLYPELE